MIDSCNGVPADPATTSPPTENLSRAASLEERLAGNHHREEPAREGIAEAWLNRWRDRAARGDPAAFDRRLAWDGWDLAAALRRLAAEGSPPAAPIQAWKETLREIGNTVPSQELLAGSAGAGDLPFPFEDLFAAHLEVARRRLERELEGDVDLISAAAWRDLDRGLAQRLSSFCAEALIAAFDEYRGERPAGLSVRLAEAGIRRDTRLYRSFLAEQALPGILGRTWPVLARLTASAVDHWVAGAFEMIRRLQEDHSRIRSLFFTDEPPATTALLGATPGLSDPHHGGRTVHILSLAEGRLVYKPRSLGPEEDFARLLDWCGERGLSLDLRLPRILDRGSHGWMEVVTPSTCSDAGAARRFHGRAGMLLGLLHAFGSRDCHLENLIACGEHPVLIDLEAWLPVRLRRWPPGGDPGEAWHEAARRIERSVLSTGLLPQWQEGTRGELRSVGGLGGGRPGRSLQPVWRAANSDVMVRVWRQVETPVQPNVPVLAGEPLEPSAFLPEVVAGFTEMYSLLLRHRDELLSPDGPLGELSGRKTRVILRSTVAYRRLLERSLSPDCCRDGAARSIELETLARVYLEAATRPDVWPLLAAERQALEQADVPLFLVPVAGMSIEAQEGELVNGALETSSLEAIRENLIGLGEEDLRRQTSFLHAALAPGPEFPATPDGEARTESGDSEQFLAAARTIAERLHEVAVLGADGSAAWIGPRYFPAGDVYELAVLGSDLYGGTAGIALFLAAFGHAADDEPSRDLALRAIATLRRSFNRSTPRELGIGGLAGVASILYALVWIGELLDQEALILEALALSARLDSQRITADRDLDVISGSAGAILALLALDRVAPGANPAGRTALEIAGECADHLLARRSTAPGAPGGWLARGGSPLAGFAHGGSGIACALLRLYERTGRHELRHAAHEAIDFERRLASARAGGGRRSRHDLTGTWCRGAPGIALARLAALDVLDGPEIRAEIGAGLEAARAQPLSAIDHLCCGNFGRVEVLFEASRILGDPDLYEAARQIAAQVLARTGLSRRFGCVPRGGPDLTDPSLFRGEAGIGFALLRLAGGNLPCLLRLA